MYALRVQFALLILVSVPVSSILGRQFEGDPQYYLDVAKTWRANIEMIETWQGHAKLVLEDRSPEAADNPKAHQTANTDFVFLKNGRFRRDTVLELRRNSIDQPNESFRMVDLILPTGNFSFGPINMDDRKQRASLVVKPVETQKISLVSPLFHPLALMTYSPGDEVDKLLTGYHRTHDSLLASFAAQPGAVVRLVKDQDLITFYTKTVQGSFQSVNEFKFDLGKGGLITTGLWQEFDGETKKSESILQIQLNEMGSIWIPASAEYDHRVGTGDYRHTSITLTDVRLNEPVDKSVFDPEKLSLKPGDLVSNLMTGESYIHEREKYEKQSVTKREPIPVFRFAVMLALFIAGAVAISVARKFRGGPR